MGFLDHQGIKETLVSGILNEKSFVAIQAHPHPVSGCSQTYLSFHLFPAVTIGGMPGRRGDTGQPGEYQVIDIILFQTTTLFFTKIV